MTYIPKLLLPTRINAGQIPIGANWTYTAALQKDSKYHVYYIGDWIDNVETSRTDYDILVIDPTGNLESTHTEAPGLPEHLGSTLEDSLYIPRQSGNYSYLILNDSHDSNGTRSATFMAIEHLDANRWYRDKLYLQGETSGPAPTSWAYEFNSSSPRIEISIAVPDTLDMFEARLYLMSNPARGKGIYLSGMPVPWETGLYGGKYDDTSYKQIIGGYNLNATGYRGNAMASCEQMGRDMLINYTSPYRGSNLLYHLVLIAERGQGNLSFLIKTDFNKPTFKIQNPISTVETGQDVSIRTTVNASRVATDHLTLEYRLNDSPIWTSTPMTAQTSNTYVWMIPFQPPGTLVTYRVTVYDAAGNEASQQLSYRTLGRSGLSISTSAPEINGGENITLLGQLNPGLQDATLSVNYTSPQGAKTIRTVKTNSTGGFRDAFKPDVAGTWTASVGWRGNELYLSTRKNASFTVRKLAISATLTVNPQEPVQGGEMRISGMTTPALRNATLKVAVIDVNGLRTVVQTTTGQDGSYTANYYPLLSGAFTVQVTYDGGKLYEAYAGQTVSVTVNPKSFFSSLGNYLLYILLAGGAAAAFIIFRWFRGRKKKTERRSYRPQFVRRSPT